MSEISYGSVTTPITPHGVGTPFMAGDQERKVVSMVQKLFHRSKRYRKKYDKDWPRYYGMGLRNRHWPTARPSFRAAPVTNYIFAAIQTIVPIMTDGKPQSGIMATNPDDIVFADFLRKVLTWWWDDTDADREVTNAIYDSCTYGTGIFRIGYNPEARHGMGDAILEAVDPMYCFPDPDATTMENCRYFIYAIPTPLSEVKRKFGEKGKNVSGDYFFDLEQFDSRTSGSEVIFTSPVDKRTSYSSNDYLRSSDPEQRVLWIECWLNDQTTEEIEIEDPETGDKVLQIQKKYPRGRVITIVGNTLLQDEQNPFSDGMIPFAIFNDYNMPREFWGQGEVEQLKQPQEDINKMDAIILEGSALMSNGIWLVQAGSVKDVDQLTNQQGLIVEYTGQRPEREKGIGVPEHLFSYRDMRVRDINIISGVNDVSRGARPEGIEAGVAIEALKESDRTRIRLKVRNLEYALRRVGKLLVSRYMQFYTEPRMISLTNDESPMSVSGQEKGPLYFNFHFEQDDSGDTKGIIQPVQPARLEQTATGMQHVPAVPGQPTEYPVKGWFDIKFNVTSALPFSKQELVVNLEKFMVAVDKNPMSPILDLYGDALEIPGADELLVKIRQGLQPPPDKQPLEPPKLSIQGKLELLPTGVQSSILEQSGVQMPQPPAQMPPNGSQSPVPIGAK